MDADHGNLRDVGLSVASLLRGDEKMTKSALPLRSGQLLRGAWLKGRTFDEVGRPKTVISVRAEPSDLHETAGPWPVEVQAGVRLLHCSHCSPSGCYDSTLHETRRWLADFLRLFEEPLETPILVHCRMGRDRTGVAIAALLLALGVDEEVVVMEYLLSHGAGEAAIRRCIEGFKTSAMEEGADCQNGFFDQYFNGAGVNLAALRLHLAGTLEESSFQDHMEMLHLENEQLRLSELIQQGLHDNDGMAVYHARAWLLEVCHKGAFLRPGTAVMPLAASQVLVDMGRPDVAMRVLVTALALAEFESQDKADVDGNDFATSQLRAALSAFQQPVDDESFVIAE